MRGQTEDGPRSNPSSLGAPVSFTVRMRPPETVSGFEELKVRACLPYQARRVEAGKTRANAESGVSDAKITDQVAVEFGE